MSACATALTTTGLVLPAWTTSSVGDAVVESGLWAVCSRNVPFITDQCDGIIEPSSSVMVARWLSILQCVVGFAAILLSVTTVTVLPYSVMLFVTLVVTLGAAALGVLAVISFGEAAARCSREACQRLPNALRAWKPMPQSTALRLASPAPRMRPAPYLLPLLLLLLPAAQRPPHTPWC